MAAIVLPELRDGDVRLRTPVPADVAEITRICADPEIQRWTRVPSPYAADDARRFVLLAIGALAEGTGAHQVIVDSEDHRRILGAVGLDLDRAERAGEIGYWVAPEARRRRVATRGARLLLQHAFAELGTASVRLQAGAPNEGSNAVARALGFRPIGTWRSGMIAGPSGDPTAPRVDAQLYDLLPDELT